MKRNVLYVIAAVAMILGSALTVHVARAVDNYAYITGGIGTDSREEMQTAGADYNLHMKCCKGVQAVGTVNFTIRDSKDVVVLQASSDGPWFFVQLPPGEYRVDAASEGQSMTKHVRIPTSTKVQELYFAW